LTIPDEVRAVVFDAVGTLLHPEPAAAEVYARIGRRFGSCLSVASIRTRFGEAFAGEESIDLAGRLRTSEERERQRWRTIVAQVLDDVSDGEVCFEALYEHFSRPESWHCELDTETALGSLAERGYRLGLASNYDRRLRRVVEGLPALRSLEHLTVSSEVGWRKPAAEFFAAIGQSFGMKPAEILCVGDDRLNDYDGALAAGMCAVLYDPLERESMVARRITRLIDLVPRP
jgi:putative hydrolase of the HAD superfamily